MGVNWGVSGSSCEIFTISVWDVFSSFGISESLGQTKINHVNVMLFLSNTNEEIVWLDISVKEMSWVNELNSLQLYL